MLCCISHEEAAAAITFHDDEPVVHHKPARRTALDGQPELVAGCNVLSQVATCCRRLQRGIGSAKRCATLQQYNSKSVMMDEGKSLKLLEQ